MYRAKKPRISDVNEHLICKLCKGYFIDATTITECLHSFCRSCIVKFLQINKYCPICDILVHKTKPLLNLRSDKTLQDIVYKLVPKLFQNEVQRRKCFYETRQEKGPKSEELEENYHIFTLDESISLTLCYYGCKESARYLRCPAGVSIFHLQKLIRAKYGLTEEHFVEILHNQECLIPSLTILDIAYIYSWKRKAPIELSYRIYEYTSKKAKLAENVDIAGNNNNWKEVQLRISENGEMSIIQDEPSELLNNNYKQEIVSEPKKTVPELKYIGKATESVTSVAINSSTTKTVFSTTNSMKCSVTTENEKVDSKSLKRKALECPDVKKKPTVLNHSLNVNSLSNNHPLKKHALNKDSEEVKETPKSGNTPCYMPKPVINIPKPSGSVPLPVPKLPKTSATKLIKSKASTPIGYKTLRDPPKSWNSQISKANVNKPDAKYSDVKNMRPAKFFKMRNNLPRYLGNPSSGVKPMYQVHVSPDKEKEKSPGEIKKHSIVKIDPKTLKPISEKAPEMTSLSNSDLKINTSSVPIFNPLKLQNSPKERKSPHLKCTSPPSKRDKLSLNFTPPNPFIPNLASPTVSPNQFLYPGGPGGFSPYDPRFMAAYMLYGQRLPFTAGLNLDMNQRKGFDLPAPTSPRIGGIPHNSQPPSIKVPNAELLSHSLQTSPRSTSGSSTVTTNSPSFKSSQILRKSNKESIGKSEKSLENTVEKLTQNRVKEIQNEAANNVKVNSEKPKTEQKSEASKQMQAPTQPLNEREKKSSIESSKSDNQLAKGEEPTIGNSDLIQNGES